MKLKRIISFLVLTVMMLTMVTQTYAEQIRFGETIASANGRVYAVKEDGSLYYWGEGTFNETAGDHSAERNKPCLMMNDVINVSAAWWGGYAIKKDGSLWNIGSYDNLDGTDKESTDPPVKIMDNIAETANGYSTFLALGTDGTLWQWGDGAGKGVKKVMTNVRHISAGMNTFYAIKKDGTLWGWGNNFSGELSIKTKDSYVNWWSALKIMDKVSYVQGVGTNAYAIKTDGTLWGWGEENAELMNKGILEKHTFNYSDGSKGDIESYFKPVKLMDNVLKITGRSHIVVVKKDHTLWGWGKNSSGELGVDQKQAYVSLRKILDHVVDVTAGGGYTIALKEDGTLWGCGTNGCGELGNGSLDFDIHSQMIQIMDKIALPGSKFPVKN